MDYLTGQLSIMIKERKLKKLLSKFSEYDYIKAVYYLINASREGPSKKSTFFLANMGLHPFFESNADELLNEIEKIKYE